MKLGIIGTGVIVSEALEALRQVETIHCIAIWARSHSKDKALALADQYKIPKVYTDYAEMLCDLELEVVYIGIINSQHYSYVKQALLAGKHVIVEKPFTSTSKEAQELVTIAKHKKLFLFEAVTLLHLPNFTAIKKALPELGEIKMVQCNYSQYSRRYGKYMQGEVLPAFDPKLSGGALYDINIYNLNFVIGLFGTPKEVHYMANIGFNGIDTSGVLTLKYDGFAAVCVGAKDSVSPSLLTIQGTQGYIRVHGAPNTLESFTLSVEEQEVTNNENLYEHRMVHEFIVFEEIYRRQDLSRCYAYLEQSLQVMAVANQARAEIGLVFPADEKK
ncbi:Gfo/Idh/MocA family protein [Propionispira raffinosivorans]|uniref:Gfo/Idh/MocA family protein n=1 Tax=Propionispira raffinosivorans TaxID=86959 RepID=UPI00035E10E8|nr:Gfo/Idh/MocA family oxidoreductase [Propionispira raffinosivorans]